ncbi:hypothetical protein EGW08_014543, partial [Elysia chlorotica]
MLSLPSLLRSSKPIYVVPSLWEPLSPYPGSPHMESLDVSLLMSGDSPKGGGGRNESNSSGTGEKSSSSRSKRSRNRSNLSTMVPFPFPFLLKVTTGVGSAGMPDRASNVVSCTLCFPRE